MRAKLVFQPPYSPDLNPIEMAWGYIKGVLKKAKARSRNSIEYALDMAVDMMSHKQVKAWCKHGGFVIK